jgi:hypothetical protein
MSGNSLVLAGVPLASSRRLLEHANTYFRTKTYLSYDKFMDGYINIGCYYITICEMGFRPSEVSISADPLG